MTKKKNHLVKISLEGIKIHGKHGVHETEKKKGNEFIVNVTVFIKPPKKGFRDDVNATVDYEKVYQTIANSFEGSVNLLETLCENTGLSILNIFPIVKKVILKVCKLNPPVGGEVNQSCVEMTFSR